MGFLDTFHVSWSSLTALGVVGLLSLLVWRRYFSAISDVPGPFAASFTRLWHMQRILKGDQNLELIRLHERHGHFVRMSYDEVSVSHPDAIKKTLLAPLRKGNWYKIHALPDYRFQSPMSTTDPKKKVEKSKYIAAAYTVSSILRSEEHIDRTFESFLHWLDIYAADKKPMDLNKFISYATFDVIGEIVFSKQFGFLEQGKDIGNAIGNSLALNAYVAVAGYFRWINIALLANPLVTWLSIMPMGHLFDLTKAVLTDREKNPNARYDAIQYWFKQNERHPDKLTIREIGTQALAAVGAGSDTVAGGIQSFIYHMIRHPDTWRRAQAEVEEAVKNGLCKDRVVSYADAQQLPFVQACVKEALRMFGPVPMGLPRIAPKGGLTIGDRTLPEGTIVSVNPWVIHYSKELWGEDADEFNPNRWLEGDIAAKEKYWIPFGAGYGSCPGQNVAKIELAKITSTLVKDYNIRQVDEKQEWKWKAYFTVVPHSWPVFIEKRT
ncbi:cytochrome P450 [Eremomyces bilateralis CBS 781.70]|uniref:Cytochrome P450 n=1 Tax=Eremomyces bilateralis CBS 781.70 TaxID=1392243 RepID=A0A6G1FWW0_9PEZI|nr:cytochrome P450 [Eremomyces bilateralis CBS 781.70]KAF1810375.1 cytochrome P450 [Eremomyces bilateralis CBS 781.70]